MHAHKLTINDNGDIPLYTVITTRSIKVTAYTLYTHHESGTQ